MLQKLADLPDRVQRVFAGDDCSVGRDDQPEQAQNAAPHDTFDETAIRQLYESRQVSIPSIVAFDRKSQGNYIIDQSVK